MPAALPSNANPTQQTMILAAILIAPFILIALLFWCGLPRTDDPSDFNPDWAAEKDQDQN